MNRILVLILLSGFGWSCTGTSDSGSTPIEETDFVISFDTGSDATTSDVADTGGGEVETDIGAEVSPDLGEDGAEDGGEDSASDVPEDAGGDTVECEQDCTDRVCGPDPLCNLSCGRCSDPLFPACNDGVCEATCSPTACEAGSSCGDPECVPICAGDECTQEELCSHDGIEVRDCDNYACSDDLTSCELTEEMVEGDGCTRETTGDVVSEITEYTCIGDDMCAAEGDQDLAAITCLDNGAPTTSPTWIDTQTCELDPVSGAEVSRTTGPCVDNDASDPCNVDGIQTTTIVQCDGDGGDMTRYEDAGCAVTPSSDPLGESRGNGTCTGSPTSCSYAGTEPLEREYCFETGGAGDWRLTGATTACNRDGTDDDPDGRGCVVFDVGDGTCDGGKCCVPRSLTSWVLDDLELIEIWTVALDPVMRSRDISNGKGLFVGHGSPMDTSPVTMRFTYGALRFNSVSSGLDVTRLRLCVNHEAEADSQDAEMKITAFAISCPRLTVWTETSFPTGCVVLKTRALGETVVVPGKLAVECIELDPGLLGDLVGTAADGIAISYVETRADYTMLYDEERAGRVNSAYRPRLLVEYQSCY